MDKVASEGLTRRAVLAAGGSLVVAVNLRPAGVGAQESGTQGAAGGAPKLPGSLEKQPLLDGWIRIDSDGNVTVFTGKAELGQGSRTVLAQAAAEELSYRHGPTQ